MYPTLLHIYGPFSIQSYGLAIALGLLLIVYLGLRDPKRKLLFSEETLFNGLSLSLIAAFAGAHILFLITDYPEFTSWWQLFMPRGFSVLGGVIGGLSFAAGYLYYKKIPILPSLDLVATYTPLVQSFGRIGCFFAGCCYGTACSLPWAITFTHPESQAPLYIALHPTQLYSALALLCIFLFMYFIAQHRFTIPGQLLGIYLMLISIERFVVDFFRDEKSYVGFITLYQWISLGIFVAGITLLMIVTLQRYNRSKYN